MCNCYFASTDDDDVDYDDCDDVNDESKII